MVGGERLLPPGWVDYSAAPTPGSERYGYAAGFWTNRGDGEGQRYRIARGIPADAFFARGANGQYVIIVPSQRLVVARFGAAFTDARRHGCRGAPGGRRHRGDAAVVTPRGPLPEPLSCIKAQPLRSGTA